MGDWKQAQPVGDKIAGVLSVALDESSLVFNDLADTGDSVVTSVVIHRQLVLLVLNLGSDGEVDAALE